MKIEKALQDWWENSRSKPKGRKGRNIQGGNFHLEPPSRKQNPRGKLKALINRTPEVMLKTRRGGKSLPHIKAHIDYISRNGNLELEDENGFLYRGKDETKEVLDNWQNEGYRISSTGKDRAEAFNLILSMPAGTDRESVKNASREFAQTVFSNHQYVVAAHEDTPQPHVHISVKMVSKQGRRLNPHKADLQEWRETFVEKLAEQGIEANATPRFLRGVSKRSEKQAARHSKNDTESHKNTPKIVLKSKSVIQAEREYEKLAKALLNGSKEDRALSLQITKFVDSWQPEKMKQQILDKQEIQKIKY